MQDTVIQDYIAPICACSIEDDNVVIKRLIGTAFFISPKGYYLTARHVIDKCAPNDADHYGLIVKYGNDKSKSHFVHLGEISHAPKPWDISLGRSSFAPITTFNWPSSIAISGWLDVFTCGYPENALNTGPEQFDINLRMLKGYITRPLNPGDLLPFQNTPNALELNFSIPQGMSGSPLFTTRGGVFSLLGVCVSSHTSEVVEHSFEEIEENGIVFREKRLKAEQYGIAHDITALSEWRPKLLEGFSLKEAIVATS